MNIIKTTSSVSPSLQLFAASDGFLLICCLLLPADSVLSALGQALSAPQPPQILLVVPVQSSVGYPFPEGDRDMELKSFEKGRGTVCVGVYVSLKENPYMLIAELVRDRVIM